MYKRVREIDTIVSFLQLSADRRGNCAFGQRSFAWCSLKHNGQRSSREKPAVPTIVDVFRMVVVVFVKMLCEEMFEVALGFFMVSAI